MTEIITYDVCASGSGGPTNERCPKGKIRNSDGICVDVRPPPDPPDEVPVQNLFPQQIIESASPGADRDITIFRSLDFYAEDLGQMLAQNRDPFRMPKTPDVITEELADAENNPLNNLDNVRYVSGLIYGPYKTANKMIVNDMGNLIQMDENQVSILNLENKRTIFSYIPINRFFPETANSRLVQAARDNLKNFKCPFVVYFPNPERIEGNKSIIRAEYAFPSETLSNQPYVKTHFAGRNLPVKAFAFNYLASAFNLDQRQPGYGNMATPTQGNEVFYKVPLIPFEETKYLDFTFQAPQPFFEEEISNIATGNPIVANVSTVISSDYQDDGSSVYGFSDTTQSEFNKKNLYRLYKENNLTVSQICNDEAGSILKFTSDNVQEFSEISEIFKSKFSKYVEISISSPGSKAHPISETLAEYEMDKYILQLITDSDGFYEKQDQTSHGRASKEVFTDQFYDTDSFSTNADQYYLQYAQPGESISDVKERINSLLPNYNDSKISQNIKDEIWTKYKDSLEFLKFTIPEDAEYTTRQGNIIPLRNLFGAQPGLFGTGSVVNELEYPLGFYRDNPRMWQLDEVKYAICSAKLKSITEPKGIRSYKDILSGEKAFSETIGYKINKHEVINGVVQEEPIQQFYLMGHGKNNTINFCDTQVIFEKTYQYEIFSINFVVGSLYTRPGFSEINFRASEAAMARFGARYHEDITSEQAWSIIEAPFFKKKVSIVDKPPLAPQVTFLPYQGIDNKLRIMLQSNFGTVSQKPVKILNEDIELIQKMRLSQPVNIATGEIQYSNDSLSSEYQSIRLDYEPRSLEDFSNSTHIRNYEAKGRTLIIEEDTFEPNKNYYYIFRAIDKRGISNPSIVYRFRLVSYANGVFMDVEEYDIKNPEIQEICFRELIQIEPSDIQKSIDFSKISNVGTSEFFLSSPSLQNIKLGNDNNNPVWGRKFKMRITSKSSSRSIDVIFKFKQEKTHIDSDNVPRTPEDENTAVCGAESFRAYMLNNDDSPSSSRVESKDTNSKGKINGGGNNSDSDTDYFY